MKPFSNIEMNSYSIICLLLLKISLVFKRGIYKIVFFKTIKNLINPFQNFE